jgi:hypothetical protein
MMPRGERRIELLMHGFKIMFHDTNGVKACRILRCRSVVASLSLACVRHPMLLRHLLHARVAAPNRSPSFVTNNNDRKHYDRLYQMNRHKKLDEEFTGGWRVPR